MPITTIWLQNAYFHPFWVGFLGVCPATCSQTFLRLQKAHPWPETHIDRPDWSRNATWACAEENKKRKRNSEM